MTTFTYSQHFAARMGDSIVTIPDQVADDQRAWDLDGIAFPALRSDGSAVAVKLDGEAYGLHTPGTGDAVVTAA